jgi:hypothetical protein
MALFIQLAGETFAKNIGSMVYTPPIVDGLLGWYLLGGDAAASRKNWAPGGADATVTGTPTYNAASAVFTSANYIDTGIIDTAALTLIAIGKPAGASNVAYVASYLNTTNTYAMLYGATSRFRAGGFFTDTNIAISSAIAQTDLARFELIAQTIANGPPAQKLYWPRRSEIVVSAPASPKLAGSRTLLIGKAYATFANTTEMAAAAVYNRALSEQEILEVITPHLIEVMELRGIIIT